MKNNVDVFQHILDIDYLKIQASLILKIICTKQQN